MPETFPFFRLPAELQVKVLEQHLSAEPYPIDVYCSNSDRNFNVDTAGREGAIAELWEIGILSKDTQKALLANFSGTIRCELTKKSLFTCLKLLKHRKMPVHKIQTLDILLVADHRRNIFTTRLTDISRLLVEGALPNLDSVTIRGSVTSGWEKLLLGPFVLKDGRDFLRGDYDTIIATWLEEGFTDHGKVSTIIQHLDGRRVTTRIVLDAAVEYFKHRTLGFARLYLVSAKGLLYSLSKPAWTDSM